jgi:hypothetical protein
MRGKVVLEFVSLLPQLSFNYRLVGRKETKIYAICRFQTGSDTERVAIHSHPSRLPCGMFGLNCGSALPTYWVRAMTFSSGRDERGERNVAWEQCFRIFRVAGDEEVP